MKAASLLPVAAIAFTLLTLTPGCVYIRTKPMPATWADALPQPSDSPLDIAGTYRNRPVSGRKTLDMLFLGETLSPRPDVIQIRWADPRTVELSFYRDGKTLVTKRVAVTRDTATGAVTPPLSVHPAADVDMGGVAWKHVQLRKGKDGHLYGLATEGGVIAALWVIPAVGSVKSWCRWDATTI